MGFWWDDEENDETPEQRNKSAMQVLLDHKNINEKTLTKRFNDIVAAQSLTMQSKMFALGREYKDCLSRVKSAQKQQSRLQTFIDVWNGFLYNVKTLGFYEANNRAEIDIAPLEYATREVDVWKRQAYVETSGKSPDTIEAWVESYQKAIQRHKDIEIESQKKADEKHKEYEEVEKSLQNKTDPELKSKVAEFVSDYKRFELAYPDSKFVENLDKMVQDSFGNKNVGEGTIFQLANRIAYGILANVFAEGRINDGEGR